MPSPRRKRWFSVYNADSQDAPPYALLHVTGVDSAGNYTVTRPTADSENGLLVNGRITIPKGQYGQAHQQFPAIIAYDTGGGTPANGNTWGAAASSWKLTTGKTGYYILGGANNGVVNATPVSSAGGGGTYGLDVAFATSAQQVISAATMTDINFSTGLGGFVRNMIVSGGGNILSISGNNLNILVSGSYLIGARFDWQLDASYPSNFVLGGVAPYSFVWTGSSPGVTSSDLRPGLAMPANYDGTGAIGYRIWQPLPPLIDVNGHLSVPRQLFCRALTDIVPATNTLLSVTVNAVRIQ